MTTVWKVLGLMGVLIVIAVAGGIGKEVGRFTVKKFNADRNEGAIEEVLRQSSNKVNSSLPMMVDKGTRLDSTLPGPGKKITYLYTTLSMQSSEVTQQRLQQRLGVRIRNSVCTSKDMKVFLDNGVQIVYRYRGSDGGIIGDVTVNPGECK